MGSTGGHLHVCAIPSRHHRFYGWDSKDAQMRVAFWWHSVFPHFMDLVSGWWFQPIWKIWVRQLGWWHSQVIWKNKSDVPVTTNQVYIIPLNHHFPMVFPPFPPTSCGFPTRNYLWWIIGSWAGMSTRGHCADRLFSHHVQALSRQKHHGKLLGEKNVFKYCVYYTIYIYIYKGCLFSEFWLRMGKEPSNHKETSRNR